MVKNYRKASFFGLFGCLQSSPVRSRLENAPLPFTLAVPYFAGLYEPGLVHLHSDSAPRLSAHLDYGVLLLGPSGPSPGKGLPRAVPQVISGACWLLSLGLLYFWLSRRVIKLVLRFWGRADCSHTPRRDNVNIRTSPSSSCFRPFKRRSA